MAANADKKGLKRICMNCGARFYDFNNRPVVCPDCETEFTGEVKTKGKRKRNAANDEKKTPKDAPEKKTPKKSKEEIPEEVTENDDNEEDEEEDDIEIISLDDAQNAEDLDEKDSDSLPKIDLDDDIDDDLDDDIDDVNVEIDDDDLENIDVDIDEVEDK